MKNCCLLCDGACHTEIQFFGSGFRSVDLESEFGIEKSLEIACFEVLDVLF
jgi:hypothetical protein